jgi:hypothetical protein
MGITRKRVADEPSNILDLVEGLNIGFEWDEIHRVLGCVKLLKI